MFNKKPDLILTISFLVILFLGFYFNNKESKVNYIPSEYEEKLISYFNEVALKSEYGDNSHNVRKWKKPMTLFISKDKEYDDQMKSIQKTVNDINKLATDGFKIVLNNHISKCNAVLYLCDKERVFELDSIFYKELSDSIDYEISGLASMEYNTEDYVINKTTIYINPEYSLGVQESAILEEITQSIGLPNDPITYSNSIFYKNKTEENNTFNEYTKIDVDVIRLLYHPKMKPGLNFKEAEKVIKRIFKTESESNGLLNKK